MNTSTFNVSAYKHKQLQLLSDYRRQLYDVAEDFDINSFQLCITGGEPLLRKDFFDILGYAHELGYHWGMTSNGTLITKDVARKLQTSSL
mgnify:CR=1 FL=1